MWPGERNWRSRPGAGIREAIDGIAQPGAASLPSHAVLARVGRGVPGDVPGRDLREQDVPSSGLRSGTFGRVSVRRGISGQPGAGVWRARRGRGGLVHAPDGLPRAAFARFRNTALLECSQWSGKPGALRRADRDVQSAPLDRAPRSRQPLALGPALPAPPISRRDLRVLPPPSAGRCSEVCSPRRPARGAARLVPGPRHARGPERVRADARAPLLRPAPAPTVGRRLSSRARWCAPAGADRRAPATCGGRAALRGARGRRVDRVAPRAWSSDLRRPVSRGERDRRAGRRSLLASVPEARAAVVEPASPRSGAEHGFADRGLAVAGSGNPFVGAIRVPRNRPRHARRDWTAQRGPHSRHAAAGRLARGSGAHRAQGVRVSPVAMDCPAPAARPDAVYLLLVRDAVPVRRVRHRCLV